MENDFVNHAVDGGDDAERHLSKFILNYLYQSIYTILPKLRQQTGTFDSSRRQQHGRSISKLLDPRAKQRGGNPQRAREAKRL
jgi:hypothetical protein